LRSRAREEETSSLTFEPDLEHLEQIGLTSSHLYLFSRQEAPVGPDSNGIEGEERGEGKEGELRRLLPPLSTANSHPVLVLFWPGAFLTPFPFEILVLVDGSAGILREREDSRVTVGGSVLVSLASLFPCSNFSPSLFIRLTNRHEDLCAFNYCCSSKPRSQLMFNVELRKKKKVAFENGAVANGQALFLS